jgi:hypothetical protein
VTCRLVRQRLSAHRDRELSLPEARAVEAHLEGCPECIRVSRSLGRVLDLVSALPRIEGSVAGDVLARLEVESQGPGLALLFRSLFSKRPLILPSLLPAALFVVAVFFGALALDGGAHSTPVLVSLEVRERGPVTQMKEGTLFLETIVGTDGNVSMIRVLDGDSAGAGAVVDALRKDRFEPLLLRGRPVSVSVYRLISRMDVWAPAT